MDGYKDKTSKNEELKEKQIDTIYGLIKQHISGIGISLLEDALNKMLPIPLNRRTLLRRLEEMKYKGQIMVRGSGNRIVYVPGVIDPGSRSFLRYAVPPETQKMIDYIHQPLSKRTPVGYNSDFLDSYRPNETFYLPASLREQLKTMGQPRFQQVVGEEETGGTYVRNIYQRLLVDLSWASSHLEGNTYTRLETLNLIEFGQVASGRDLKETQMILNHKAAIELLVANIDRIAFNPLTILTLHANLSYNLLPDPLDSGRLRQGPVEIAGTVYLPMAIPDYIQSMFHKLLKKAHQITDPYEQSFFIMVHLPYLQPFIDMNKRVSRLASNIPFLRHDLCPLSFIDVDEQLYMDGLLALYELNGIEVLREVYLWAYERSCQRYVGIVQSMIGPDPLRLRYKDVIFSVIKNIVEEMKKPTTESIDLILREYTYNPIDHNALRDIILKECTYIHEGNVGRYGITPSQYYNWKASLVL
ncbi:MAG: hypothetical protein K0R52_1197 [Alphaproteobacteria bacterium]|jgi:hypothetical protein|nr:hypothetical protein [Alphaproteobacteria bacterium]